LTRRLGETSSYRWLDLILPASPTQMGFEMTVSTKPFLAIHVAWHPSFALA
jgi:hypothetical protein